MCSAPRAAFSWASGPRIELGALLPQSHDLEARQLGCRWDARHPFFPVLDSRPADGKLLCRLCMRISKRLLTMAALSLDSKPHEAEPGNHQQGLKDQIQFAVREVMKSKYPMDPHNVEAEDKACAREYTQEE